MGYPPASRSTASTTTRLYLGHPRDPTQSLISLRRPPDFRPRVTVAVWPFTISHRLPPRRSTRWWTLTRQMLCKTPLLPATLLIVLPMRNVILKSFLVKLKRTNGIIRTERAIFGHEILLYKSEKQLFEPNTQRACQRKCKSETPPTESFNTQFLMIFIRRHENQDGC